VIYVNIAVDARKERIYFVSLIIILTNNLDMASSYLTVGVFTC